MNTPSITCPIATRQTSSAVMNQRWMVECSEYSPKPATFEPLVNGERAFGAVHDAIMAAKHSVDIICWGFQPSMHFKRGGGQAQCIGELLVIKASLGVKVRVLCWSDSAHLTAMFAENMTPGRNVASFVSPAGDWRSTWQQAYDWEWYRRASTPDTRASSLVERVFPGLKGFRWIKLQAQELFKAGARPFENIEFAVRDLGLADRAEIAYQIWMRSREQGATELEPAGKAAAMSVIPTHHQKMVLVDYEHADRAVGFVMGHNMLDPYWDRDDHAHARADDVYGRNGFTPRQDISSRVTGPVLQDLNANFTQAWLKATGINLQTARESLAANLKPRKGFGPPMMAQVLRTQTEAGKRDIRTMYLQAVNNATQFIYIENQYFRWKPFADAVVDIARRHAEGGRDPGEHGYLHLFVVTNSSDEGMADGALGTFRMLRQLGRSEVMPSVARLEHEDYWQAKLDALHEEYIAAQVKLAAYYNRVDAMGRLDGPIERLEIERDELARQYAELKKQLQSEKSAPITPIDVPGLKVHICTLVAPDSPPDNWLEVYIHSKLMIVDDVFTTLGSANINERSMSSDSELNICVEDPAVAKPLRRQLWGLHTGDNSSSEDISTGYQKWSDVLTENNDRRNPMSQTKLRTPACSLVEFLRLSPSRKNVD
jgi:phosphatidylserine/phosphatidylglycerophosphate/cardiolipin synthase-like enzyme